MKLNTKKTEGESMKDKKETTAAKLNLIIQLLQEINQRLKQQPIGGTTTIIREVESDTYVCWNCKGHYPKGSSHMC